MSTSPLRQREADNLTMNTLSRSVDGRNSTFETRMAMQRELDSARYQLKDIEREGDDLRRQTMGAREEAAVHRAENSRLAEELRSCRARLNSALDSQQDLLQKNAEKHERILDLQNQNAVLMDEVAAKSALSNNLRDHNEQLQVELGDYQHNANTTQRTMDDQLQMASDDLSAARARLAAVTAENESLQATVDTLRAEMRKRDSDIGASSAETGSLRRELTTTQEELASAQNHIANLTTECDTLRSQLTRSDNELVAARSTEESLARALHDREAETADLNTTKANVEAQLESTKAKERVLEEDLRNMTRYAGRREVSYLDWPLRYYNGSYLRDYRYYDYPLSASRRAVRLAALRTEREEADRLADLARIRLRTSLRTY